MWNTIPISKVFLKNLSLYKTIFIDYKRYINNSLKGFVFCIDTGIYSIDSR